jgi:hypothetical protein
VGQASVFDVVQDYGQGPNPDQINYSPYWALAIIQLGQTVTYSRDTKRGIGKPVDGVFSRNIEPIIITDDCTQVFTTNQKTSHIKVLNATLKPASGLNYLDQDVMVAGDWLFAWNWTNQKDAQRVIQNIKDFKACNGFRDGLKFIGRVHSIRKRISIAPGPKPDKTVSYQLQGTGFGELESVFFYDLAMATSAERTRLSQFLGQIGLDYTKIVAEYQEGAGIIENNVDNLMVSIIDLVLGSGSKLAYDSGVNDPIKRAVEAVGGNTGGLKNLDRLVLSPQSAKEAPFSYLVPVTVGYLLGIPKELASKGGEDGLPEAYGYSDVLQSIMGVQQFIQATDNNSRVFFPYVDTARSNGSRWFCDMSLIDYGKLKGTNIIVEPSFINTPVWSVLQQYLNPTINEMYTALKVVPSTNPDNPDGSILPTLVVRQIPFSTESMPAYDDFLVTRFLSLPRWKIHPAMVRNLDVGRSDATRTNLVHVYGNAEGFGSKKSISTQMVVNPPIFDEIDIMRCGIHAEMRTVNCSVVPQMRTPQSWMEAIADWTIGSHHTLNGSIQCTGIQLPIAEGDNLELEGIAYHIESVDHDCSISPDGRKYFYTTMTLSNGMPIDQGDPSMLIDFPRYPGFTTVNKYTEDASGNITQVDENSQGENEVLTSLDPGITAETV